MKGGADDESVQEANGTLHHQIGGYLHQPALDGIVKGGNGDEHAQVSEGEDDQKVDDEILEPRSNLGKFVPHLEICLLARSGRASKKGRLSRYGPFPGMAKSNESESKL